MKYTAGGRDGNQNYQGLDNKDLYRYYEATRPLTEDEIVEEVEAKLDGRYYGRFWGEDYACWPPQWYKRMMRK